MDRQDRGANDCPDELSQAVNALHWMTVAAGRSCERSLVLRALAEAEAAMPEHDAAGWAARMVDIADRFHIRLVKVVGPASDLLPLLREGLPAAVYLKGEALDGRWLIIDRYASDGYHVRRSHRPSQVELLSHRQLLKAFGKETDSITYLLAQQVLSGASSASGDPGGEEGSGGAAHGPLAGLSDLLPGAASGNDSHGHDHGHDHGHGMSPLSRLMALLRPERTDILAIIVFAIFVGLLTLVTPLAVEAMVNTVAFGRNASPVLILAVIVLTFLGFSSGIRGLLTLMTEIIQRRLFVRVVEDLAYRLPRVRGDVLRSAPLNEKINQFFDIVTVQKIVASMLLDGLAIVLQTIVGMAVLAFYHPFLLGFDIVLLAAIAFVIFILGKGAVSTAIKESKSKYAVAAWLEELARHPTTFRMHAGRRLGLDRADDLTIRYLEARRKHFRILMRQVIFSLALQAIAATTLLALGGWLVIARQLTLGQLVAAELIVTVIVSSFAKIGKHLESYYDLLASVDKLGGLFDLPLCEESQFTPLDPTRPVGMTLAGGRFIVEQGFGIQRGAGVESVPRVERTRLEIQPGESLAMVGPSGCGKSQLLEAIAGLAGHSGWTVHLQGVDVREIRRDAMDAIVGIALDVEIFRGSLGENVQLARSSIRQTDIRMALEMMELGHEVDALPDGIETQLLTDGHPLSSNQRVRLMLARAMAAKPKVVLIDGLLDMLPDAQATRILDRLLDPQAGRTILLVTGRTALIQRMKHIAEIAQATDVHASHES